MKILAYRLTDELAGFLRADFQLEEAENLDDLRSLASRCDEYGFDAFVAPGAAATGLRRYTKGVIVSIIDEDSPVARAIQIERGADYCLTKPHPEEVRAYIHAGIRRTRDFRMHIIRAGCVGIDLGHSAVTVHGKPVHLTKTEHQIVEVLALKQGAVVAKDHLYDLIYGHGDGPEIKIIDVFTCKLRKKGIPIRNRWGRGYRLDVDPCPDCKPRENEAA